MERRTHLSEEVWASFNDAMDQFHKTMNEANKTFRCVDATFLKADKAFDEGHKEKGKRPEISLTLRNRFLLIRLAFSLAKRVRF
jgi:hypothetical protein